MSTTDNGDRGYDYYKAQSEKLLQASGGATSDDPLVGLIYLLVRDEVTMGKMEYTMRQLMRAKGTMQFTNGWLAQYAKDVAARIREMQKNDPFAS